jgi:zona occludens toxin
MITLVTGTPGTGKTAWVLKELFEFRKNNPNYYIFVHGVRNLRGIAFEPVYCRSQLCDICRSSDIPETAKYVENWQDWKEPESLIVVDEVQRIWRPRVGSSQITPAVALLETHRHYGVDFWLISQGAHLFDNFIRLLVGRHIHLVANWAGRKQFEWSECHQDTSSRGDAIVRPYKLPKHIFNHYDSAEVHTKQDKRKPLSLYGVIILFCIASALIYNIYHRMSNRVASDTVKPVSTVEKTDTKSAEPVPASSTTEKPKYPDFKPTVDGVPESAPAYAELLKVTAVPTLEGCIYSESKDDCRCYTKQATIYPTSKNYCIEQIKGHVFNPYFVKSAPTPSTSTSSAKASSDKSEFSDTDSDRSSELVSSDIHMTASDDM